MMQLVAIMGSPRGMKGSTGHLLGEVVKEAENHGSSVQTFSVARMDIQPCRACDVCHKEGRCVIEDDWETVRQAMLDADGIILASPNYIFSVTAQLKAMLDRTSGLIHCLALDGKYGAAVVTSGGSGSDVVASYLLSCLRAFGCWTVGSIGAEAWQLRDEAISKPIVERATSLGRDLVSAIRQRKTFPDQEQERRAFFERMKTLVTAMKDEWPFEHEYWRSHGRL